MIADPVGMVKGTLLVSDGWTWSALATVVSVPIAAIPSILGVVDARPVRSLNEVPVATPMLGFTSVGEVANTAAPVPVSSVSIAARFALEGVDKKVRAAAGNDVVANVSTPVA